MDPWPQSNLAAIPNFNLILAMTALLRTTLVRYPDRGTRLSQKRCKVVFRCRQPICMVLEYEPVSLSLYSDYGTG